MKRAQKALSRLPKAAKKAARDLGLDGPLSPIASAVLLIAPVLAAALFYVWTHVTTLELGYALSEAAETHRGMLEQNRALRVEVAALRAPERLKELAKTRFKLTAPKTEQVIRLEDKQR